MGAPSTAPFLWICWVSQSRNAYMITTFKPNAHTFMECSNYAHIGICYKVCAEDFTNFTGFALKPDEGPKPITLIVAQRDLT